MTFSDSLPKLPARPATGHKGTFGTVAVIGGCALKPATDDEQSSKTWAARMIGGPAFTALAALRAGCGLARLCMPESILNAGLTIAPSATGVTLPVDDLGDLVPHSCAQAIDELRTTCDCIAIGPGLGTSPGAQAAVFRMISQDECPVVIDADAVNCLGLIPEVQRDFRATAVLTPHPGEFERLSKSFGLSANSTDASAHESGAESLARYLGCIVVLKSSTTIVTDGHETWKFAAPNPVLATAGTGDVLTGIIASFIAQFTRPAIPAGSMTVTSQQRGGLSLFDATRLGVVVHSAAARRWADHGGFSAGMLAADLIDEIPAAVQALRTGEAANP